MLESESLSMISLPDISFPKSTVIPLACWQDVCLSEIWIPKHLLTNRQNPSNTWETQGVFHTLDRRDTKQIESFSIYSDSDNESEADIFESDSDEAFDLDSISSETMKTKDDSQKSIEETEKGSMLKSLSTQSNISLNEILNPTKDVDLTNFEFKNNYQYAYKQEEPLQLNKKSKNAKKKKKVVKSVTLDQFLEDYTEEDKQEAYANDYLQKLLAAKDKGITDEEVQLKNTFEFPDLKPKAIEFMHSGRPNIEKPKITIKAVAQFLSQSDENENDFTNIAEIVPTPETTVGKIVIENIPSNISQEDIFTLLCGYGEIVNFSLETDGEFSRAIVEIDLICDFNIDWITECLNETEPFGTSSRLLKCYKL